MILHVRKLWAAITISNRYVGGSCSCAISSLSGKPREHPLGRNKKGGGGGGGGVGGGGGGGLGGGWWGLVVWVGGFVGGGGGVGFLGGGGPLLCFGAARSLIC